MLMGCTLGLTSDCSHVTRKLALAILVASASFLFLDLVLWASGCCSRFHPIAKALMTWVFPLSLLYL